MGKIKLGNGLNIENVMFGSTQIQKVYMGTTLIFPDCSLDVIGWDNSSNIWKPITIYYDESNPFVTYYWFHNGIGSTPEINDRFSSDNSGTTLVLQTTDPYSYRDGIYEYSISTSGIVAQKQEIPI